MAINLVYFGTPDFSATILNHLLSPGLPNVKVVAVVTNPDRPTGRKQILTPSPVAQLATSHHLPVFKPGNLDAANLSHLKLLSPDVFLVVAYGKIIPDNWITTPRLKTLNLHFSLLPKHRGALCLQQAIKNQDQTTGVTLMEIDSQLDHGPIISQAQQNIDLSDNIASLQIKLTQVATHLLSTTLPDYLAGKITSQPQDDSLVTYTPSLTTLTHQSAYISWDQLQSGKPNTHALIRSLNPEPGAWTTIKGQELKIISTHLDQDKLIIDTVQKPGKKPITWSQFCQQQL